ncbi:hypothetical protein BU17DRAFT_62867 [Hysterangium stoloniferum]|nr:hypothetical protein BU17DRAFT_62867 [Hysterangium stoloniferum]
MSDPRFARLKTDPRFRKPRKKNKKVVIDDRFKSIFDEGEKTKGGNGKRRAKETKIDKYGRKISVAHDSDNLKRFYRLEEDEEGDNAAAEPSIPDLARGEVLLESSDEEAEISDESDDGEVILGRNIHRPIQVLPDEPEIDLDESQFAELDAIAEVNAAKANETSPSPNGEQTNRIAIVNLDWDHVRAQHLFKIFSSVVSPPNTRESDKTRPVVHKGKVLNVRIYPSEFGKTRLEKEKKEGPPKEIFKKRDVNDVDGPLIEEDDGNEYDEAALRNYQLERLRYYYAIVSCDTVSAAAHVYSELDGTELERSANVFDLSFVPNDMEFTDDFTDEATQDVAGSFKAVEFVTDALRHSKVKLTWDDDDPERTKVTRRTLSRKEIDESDFKAYIASSGSSGEESDAEGGKGDRLRALLLGGAGEDNELLPEGWGQNVDKAGEMEITFTPGLRDMTASGGGEEETTLERYLRKQKEKRKQRKAAKAEVETIQKAPGADDEFFGDDSGEDNDRHTAKSSVKRGVKSQSKDVAIGHVESTPAELELLLASTTPSDEPKHFDMRSVIKAEKSGSKKRSKKGNKKNHEADESEIQQDFTINVKDDRFKALHEDHAFAIDPTNPHFKKTKSMSALLEERAKRQRRPGKAEEHRMQQPDNNTSRSLKGLVESVKRKSALVDDGGGKRRKV